MDSEVKKYENVIVEAQETPKNDTPELDEISNRESQPKLNSTIVYKVIGEDDCRQGKVSAVGKKEGNHKFIGNIVQ